MKKEISYQDIANIFGRTLDMEQTYLKTDEDHIEDTKRYKKASLRLNWILPALAIAVYFIFDNFNLEIKGYIIDGLKASVAFSLIGLLILKNDLLFASKYLSKKWLKVNQA